MPEPQVRQLVKDEIADMKRQMQENDFPGFEPEPNASRFDAMTPEERHYVAQQLGL